MTVSDSLRKRLEKFLEREDGVLTDMQLRSDDRSCSGAEQQQDREERVSVEDGFAALRELLSTKDE